MIRRRIREIKGEVECILTQKQLASLCKQWQKRLNLQDWTIKVKLVRQDDADMSANQGYVYYHYSTKTATIKILDHRDWGTDEWLQDMELTLVHELNHIHTGLFCPKHDTDEEEHCVEFLARALVKLKRERDAVKKGKK